MRCNTIQEVLDQLDKIIMDAETNASREGYFAVLYRRMTLAVEEGCSNKAFADVPAMIRLDTHFAARFIDAYEAFHTGKPLSKGWKIVFDACSHPGLTVIQHLILGVNTHINLDLAIAAAETSPGAGIMDLQADFDRINTVIGSLVEEVQEKLSRVWWPLRFLRKISNHREDAVINFSIETARKTAWANAVALATIEGEAHTNYIQGIDQMVTAIAARIIKPGFMVLLLLKLVRWLEYRDVKRVIQLIK